MMEDDDDVIEAPQAPTPTEITTWELPHILESLANCQDKLEKNVLGKRKETLFHLQKVTKFVSEQYNSQIQTVIYRMFHEEAR